MYSSTHPTHPKTYTFASAAAAKYAEDQALFREAAISRTELVAVWTEFSRQIPTAYQIVDIPIWYRELLSQWKKKQTLSVPADQWLQ
jgi:hypothetical protein